MSEFEPDEYEKAAGGLDYDEDAGTSSGKADGAGMDWSERLQQEGPLAILQDVEEMLPEPVRVQVASFPLTAVAVGLGVGLFLGMRKSEPIIAAITAAISSSAAKGFGSIVDD